MDKIDWVYILAIVVLICVTVLGITGTISPQDLKEIFIIVITALISGSVAYYYGKHKGLYQGRYGV